MDSERIERLASRMEELNNQSVRFDGARRILLSEGYSDEEIIAATHVFPYGATQDQPSAAFSDVSGDTEPDTGPHEQLSVQSPKLTPPGVSASSSGRRAVVNYVLRRVIAALGMLDAILLCTLSPTPWRPETYVVQYWLAGVTLGLFLLIMATRSLKLTWKNSALVGIGLIAAIGIFIIARHNEYMVKTYSSEKCLQMLRSATTNSTLPAPGSELPSACLEKAPYAGFY